MTLKILAIYYLQVSSIQYNTGGRTYLVGEGVILVWDQQDGGKNRQISTPVSAFSAIVGVSLKSATWLSAMTMCVCFRTSVWSKKK